MVSFQGRLEASGNRLWGHHVRVPAAAAAPYVAAKQLRVVCAFDGHEPFQCALTPIGGGQYVIKINKQWQRKLGVEEGSSIEVDMWPDDSDYGLPMPEELSELLQQDAAADQLFHALSAGKQRTLLYLVNQGKDSDQRIARAVVLAEHLKARQGRIDFRALYGDLH